MNLMVPPGSRRTAAFGKLCQPFSGSQRGAGRLSRDQGALDQGFTPLPMAPIRQRARQIVGAGTLEQRTPAPTLAIGIPWLVATTLQASARALLSNTTTPQGRLVFTSRSKRSAICAVCTAGELAVTSSSMQLCRAVSMNARFRPPQFDA
ncbi:hypothetical protein [Methylibium sp.]|uniref:hypothetical protein n=1 Tax=Methylibium sp. TaxID=2067992 RepID=UPI001804D1F4|nr:hypothetical protein [Methylibium sp.]MBA3589162.1 hypothetical protein [Methylibium sp.]